MKYRKLGKKRWKVGKYVSKHGYGRVTLAVLDEIHRRERNLPTPGDKVVWHDVIAAYGVIVAAVALGALVSKLI